MKMLYILNIAKRVNNFSYTSMIAAQECGFEFHIAGNWSYESNEELAADEKKYGIRIHQIDFIRKPYSLKNRKAYKQLLELCKNENFDVIHCNTPVGGLLGRLVGSKCKVKKVIYQAHGFHFYKGAPWVNWLIYYPIEKWLAKKTDFLITINKEDYELAKMKMHIKNGGSIMYVPGVGIDLKQYINNDGIRYRKRLELGIKKDDFIIISTGDLVKRKNYSLAIRIIAMLDDSHVHYLICGDGPEKNKLSKLIQKYQISGNIHLLGYRKDVNELYNASDAFLFTSKQEGLARSLMEAMASHLPCVVSRIRGNIDLLGDDNSEFLCDLDNERSYVKCLRMLIDNDLLRRRISIINYERIHSFNLSSVVSKMKEVYSGVEK